MAHHERILGKLLKEALGSRAVDVEPKSLAHADQRDERK
jgi:hypothetical protein